jgi:hypothetical protein
MNSDEKTGEKLAGEEGTQSCISSRAAANVGALVAAGAVLRRQVDVVNAG